MASAAVEIKKPQTAYFMWFNAKREEIQKQVGSKDFGIVTRKGGELWKTASAAEKTPFEKEAARQKDEFEKLKATPEGQKALEEQKAAKKDEKKAIQEKKEEKMRAVEEKQIVREKRAAKVAVKAVEKDDKLKKPLSPYFAWLNDNRAKITASLGGKGGPEVTKKGAEMWKSLPESQKKPYDDHHKKAKEAHDAYLETAEGAAALKAYKDATSAVAYKEPVKEASKDESAEEDESKSKSVGQKRKTEEAGAEVAAETSSKKARARKAGA